MKILLTNITALLLMFPLAALAQSVVSLPNPLASSTFEELVNAVINWLLLITLPIVTLLIVYAAAQIMFAGANPKQREEAINIIKYAIIGYGVILISKIIVAVIQELFG